MGAPSELEEVKVAVRASMRANVERNDLNDGLLVSSALKDLVELSPHDRRPTDLAVQNGLIQQDSIAWRDFLFQQLLAP